MQKPNWSAIRAHYEEIIPEILAEIRNEWAVDPYHWSGVMTMTPIEDFMWSAIREVNAIFYPQYQVGRFFVDFANPVARVAIECDGAAYHQDVEKDAERDRDLNAMGWVVYRITGSECNQVGYPEIGRLGTGEMLLRQIALVHGLTRKDSMKEFCIQSLKRHERSYQPQEFA